MKWCCLDLTYREAAWVTRGFPGAVEPLTYEAPALPPLPDRAPAADRVRGPRGPFQGHPAEAGTLQTADGAALLLLLHSEPHRPGETHRPGSHVAARGTPGGRNPHPALPVGAARHQRHVRPLLLRP